MGDHASVSEIRRYPMRPRGFEEPLFHDRGSRAAVMEHFLGASWLRRASELPRHAGAGTVARAVEEPVEVRRLRARGPRVGAEIVVPGSSRLAGDWGGRRGTCVRREAARRVLRVLDRWREVAGWWDAPSERVDRLVFRLELARRGGAGAVVDVSLDRSSGRWLVVGVVD